MNIKKLEPRQKIIAILLGVVLIVLVWQVYELFAVDKTAPIMHPLQPIIAKSVPVMKAAMMNSDANTAGAATAIDPASNSQAEYLRLVNEYQMAQLQRMIAEDNEAIAVAKQNAAKAMSETSKLAGGNLNTMTTDTDTQPTSNDYQLVYTGQQTDGQWNATLKKADQIYDVVAGRQLPDGTQVMSIDENGVLLTQNNGIKKLVTFSGATQIAAAPVVNPDNKTPLSPINTSQNVVKPAVPIVPAVAPVKSVAVVQPTVKVVSKTLPAQTKPVSVKVTPVPQVPALPAVVTQTIALPISSTNIKFASDKNAAYKNMPLVVNKTVPVIAKKPAPVVAVKAEVKQPVIVLGSVQKNTVAATTAHVAVAVAKTPPLAQAPNAVEQQLMAINPNNYTIQLTADHDLQSVRDFIKTNQLDGQATYFAARDVAGHTLYVLIYGQYPDAQAAQAAFAKLPSSAKQEGAFIARYSAVQTILTRSEKAAENTG